MADSIIPGDAKPAIDRDFARGSPVPRGERGLVGAVGRPAWRQRSWVGRGLARKRRTGRNDGTIVPSAVPYPRLSRFFFFGLA